MFPFNHILDETELIFALPVSDIDYGNLNSISKLLFVPFELNEDPSYTQGLQKYDSDVNFSNEISQNVNVNAIYYLMGLRSV